MYTRNDFRTPTKAVVAPKTAPAKRTYSQVGEEDLVDVKKDLFGAGVFGRTRSLGALPLQDHTNVATVKPGSAS